jgi:hypothetical protein
MPSPVSPSIGLSVGADEKSAGGFVQPIPVAARAFISRPFPMAAVIALGGSSVIFNRNKNINGTHE